MRKRREKWISKNRLRQEQQKLERQIQKQQEIQTARENEVKNKIMERLEFMSRKRSQEREIREKNMKEAEIRQREINSKTYLYEKINKSQGILVLLIFSSTFNASGK